MPASTSRSHTKNSSHNGHANGKTAAAPKRASAAKSDAKSNGANHKQPSWFTLFAQKTAQLAGRPFTFMVAVLVIIVWGVSGPLFNYSDTWQLVINTGTTIITFLMVFLIQHSQNRDTQAIQLKLDELIRVNQGARNSLLDLEDMSEQELERVKEAFCRVAETRGHPELARGLDRG
jgi:low affinity Fe/Cu permease